MTVVSFGKSFSSSSVTRSHFDLFFELGVDGPATVVMVGMVGVQGVLLKKIVIMPPKSRKVREVQSMTEHTTM